VPGSKGGYVLVKDAVKRRAPDGLPFPAALRAAPEAAESSDAALSTVAEIPEAEIPEAEMPEGEQS
jgi:large subunit ribosomal protein L3